MSKNKGWERHRIDPLMIMDKLKMPHPFITYDPKIRRGMVLSKQQRTDGTRWCDWKLFEEILTPLMMATGPLVVGPIRFAIVYGMGLSPFSTPDRPHLGELQRAKIVLRLPSEEADAAPKGSSK